MSLFAEILGTGRAVPEKVLTNADLEKMVDTTDEWITERTGIKERRIGDEKTTASSLGTEAALKAMEMAGVTADELDLILVATVTPDMPFPSASCMVQKNLEAWKAAALDLGAGCTGFIYGLSVADGFIKSGQAKTILLVGVEILTKITDWTVRSTCVLFGDGAGAVVLQASSKILEQVKMKPEQIDILIPHQANLRIIQATAKRLKLPMEKVYVNIDRYGNTSSASIPIALDEVRRSDLYRPGMKILLVAFGAGLTWGSAVVTI